MSLNITLNHSPFSLEGFKQSSRLGKTKKSYIEQVSYMKNIQAAYNKHQKLFALESLISTNDIAIPSGPAFIARQQPTDRQLILSSIATSYYEDVMLSKFLQITDYIIGVCEELPNDIQVDFEASPVMDIENTLKQLLVYTADGDLPNLTNLIKSIESQVNQPFNLTCLKSYLLNAFKLINSYRENLISLYTRTQSVSEFIDEALTRDTDCIACLTNKLVLAFYRNSIDLLVTAGKSNLPSGIYDIVLKFQKDIEPIDKNDIDAHIAELVGETDLETGVALEAANEGITKRVLGHIKAIFKFLKDKIVAFFKFVGRLFTHQKNIKEKIDEETNNLTPEEKKKAEDAGQPKYYMDEEEKKIHAFDKDNKYIVSMNLKSPNTFSKQNSKEIEKKVEEKKDQIKPMQRGLASIEEILSCAYSKSDTVDNIIYGFINSGKDPVNLLVNGSKLIYGYLNSDFEQEARNAISKSKDDKNILSLGSGSFSKLEKVITEINTLTGGDVEKDGSIDIYVRNTMRGLRDRDEETKFDDNFINKIKNMKIDTSYEDFVKVADQDVPKIREDLFTGISDNEQGVFCNKLLRIYQNLVSIYRDLIKRGTNYYQLVYIPLAVAHNIGEIGEKATKLYAAKRKAESEKSEEE